MIRKLLSFGLLIGLLFVVPGQVRATVLTFDDLPGSGPTSIPDDYGGLDWTNMFYADSDVVYPNSGYANGTVSGDNVAFNGFGGSASAADGTFDFNGVSLTGAWRDDLSIQVTGFSGGTQLYTQTVVVDSTSPTWFQFDFLGIDNLVFNSFGGTENPMYPGSGVHFAMDNFRINASAVPEPASFSLLAMGAVGVAGGALRRRRGARKRVRAG